MLSEFFSIYMYSGAFALGLLHYMRGMVLSMKGPLCDITLGYSSYMQISYTFQGVSIHVRWFSGLYLFVAVGVFCLPIQEQDGVTNVNGLGAAESKRVFEK